MNTQIGKSNGIDPNSRGAISNDFHSGSAGNERSPPTEHDPNNVPDQGIVHLCQNTTKHDLRYNVEGFLVCYCMLQSLSKARPATPSTPAQDPRQSAPSHTPENEEDPKPKASDAPTSPAPEPTEAQAPLEEPTSPPPAPSSLLQAHVETVNGAASGLEATGDEAARQRFLDHYGMANRYSADDKQVDTMILVVAYVIGLGLKVRAPEGP